MSSIKTKQEYELALDEFEILFDAALYTKESERADELADLIEEYEKTHYPINE